MLQSHHLIGHQIVDKYIEAKDKKIRIMETQYSIENSRRDLDMNHVVG